MASLKRFLALCEKEWIEFYKSKAWIIVVMLPLFITFIYKVVYQEVEQEGFQVGYVQTIDPGVKQLLISAKIKLIKYSSQNSAETALKQHDLDGIIKKTSVNSPEIILTVEQSKLKQSTLLVNQLNLALLQAYSQKKIPQIQLAYLNQSKKSISNRWASMPSWLIQIILTVCLLQASASIADEKERQTLHGLLISPMSIENYLTAKIVWTTILGVGSIYLTIALTGYPAALGATLLITCLGGLVFAALALLIGLASPNALFARTMATLIYLASALPLMLQEISFAAKWTLNLFPSFLLLKQFEATLLSSFSQQFLTTNLILAGEGLIIIILTLTYIKQKADF